MSPARRRPLVVAERPPVETYVTRMLLEGRDDGDVLSFHADGRAKNMLTRLARWKGISKSRLVRELLFEEYLRFFGKQPPGATLDEPPQFDSARRRAYQDAYSKTYRNLRAAGHPLPDVRAGAREAAREASRRAAGPTSTSSWRAAARQASNNNKEAARERV